MGDRADPVPQRDDREVLAAVAQTRTETESEREQHRLQWRMAPVDHRSSAEYDDPRAGLLRRDGGVLPQPCHRGEQRIAARLGVLSDGLVTVIALDRDRSDEHTSEAPSIMRRSHT